tara:strand:+ start:2625 stop:4010 length:1386 start_codon:yes stop_codon:yes gene_type:complete
MGKFVAQNHITGEKGVLKFATYCANHEPYIIFREETKHDYGIDGEIEITRKTSQGKREATAKVVKIQLKATRTKAYISGENENSFEFIAKDNDIKYWMDHSSEVVLIVFFEKENQLYAKKIDKNYVLKNRKTHKLVFNKSKNALTPASNFEEIVQVDFKSRVSFDKKEILQTNLIPVHLPQIIHCYESKYTDVKKIFHIINENNLSPVPQFNLESSNLYTLESLDNFNSILRDNILQNQVSNKIPLHQFIKKGQVEKNIVVKIINRYLKEFLGRKGIYYNPKYRRFYFANFNETPLKIDKKATSTREVYRYEKSKGKSGRLDKRAVVSKYTYYEKTSFFRHFAFQISYEWINSKLFLILDPKYYFTYDGQNLLDDHERISKLTNKIKLSEHNTQYLNHLYFLRNYFDRGKLYLFIEDNLNSLYMDKIEKIQVDFGISEGNGLEPKRIEKSDANQTNLFENI